MIPNCKLAPEVRGVHDNLPFVSHIDLGNASTIENATLPDVSGVDYIIRAVFWGLFIPLMAGFLLVVSCYCYCCACCACAGMRKRGQSTLGLKVVLGALNIIILTVCVILLFVGFWAESSLDKGLLNYADEINNFINNYTVVGGDVVSIVVLDIEHSRHNVFIGYLCVLLAMVVTMMIIIALAPVCKTPVIIYVFLGIFCFVTLITSVVSGFVFAVIVLLADACVGLYDIPVQLCEDEFAVVAESLDIFCNKSFHYGFVLFVLACVLIMLFVAVQILSVYFGATVSRRRQSETLNTASEVWDAYEPARGDRTYSPRDAYTYNSDKESAVPLMSVVDD